MNLLSLLIATILLLAASNVALAKEWPQAETFAELHTRDVRELERLVEGAIGLDDRIYLTTLAGNPDHGDRLLRRYQEDVWNVTGPRNPYLMHNAPLIQCILTGDTASNERTLRDQAELLRVKNAHPEAIRRAFPITQVLPNGFLSIDHRIDGNYFIECDSSNLVDGQAIIMTVVRDGTYNYTTVMGGAATARRARAIESGKVRRWNPTAEDLFEYVKANGITSVQVYRPEVSVLDRPNYTTSRYGSGAGTVRTSRNLSSRGRVTLVWDSRDQPINIRKSPRLIERD